MTILRHPIFITLTTLAAFVYISSMTGLALPKIISFYLNDLLCMPVVLSICLVIMRRLKRKSHLYIPLSAIVVITAYFSFHFEWLLPKFLERYTGDIIDVGLYIIGALLFYVFQKQLF